MNILILTNHFNAGGISSYILSLSCALSSRGHKVYVGSSGGEWAARLEKYNIAHIYLPLRTKSIASPKLFFAYLSLCKITKEKHIEIIHAQTRVSSFLAFWLSKKTSIPYLTTIHGFFRARLGRRLFPCWGDMVIAISQPVKQHLIQDFKLSESRIKLVHNGVDTQYSILNTQYAIRKEETKKKLGLGSGPVVGIIARLSEVKGHKYLIMAMQKVISEIPEAQLLSIGDGPIKKDLQVLAESLRIEKNVNFIAALPDTKEAMSIMDVFALPSLQEGLGLAIMEAMSWGVPVAASSVGGIVSLIKHNETGLLVGPADPEGLSQAIIDLLKNKQKAQDLANSARELVLNEFSLEKMAEGTEEAYRQCLRYNTLSTK